VTSARSSVFGVEHLCQFHVFITFLSFLEDGDMGKSPCGRDLRNVERRTWRWFKSVINVNWNSVGGNDFLCECGPLINIKAFSYSHISVARLRIGGCAKQLKECSVCCNVNVNLRKRQGDQLIHWRYQIKSAIAKLIVSFRCQVKIREG